MAIILNDLEYDKINLTSNNENCKIIEKENLLYSLSIDYSLSIPCAFYSVLFQSILLVRKLDIQIKSSRLYEYMTTLGAKEDNSKFAEIELSMPQR
jgi:hypothetical protein